MSSSPEETNLEAMASLPLHFPHALASHTFEKHVAVINFDSGFLETDVESGKMSQRPFQKKFTVFLIIYLKIWGLIESGFVFGQWWHYSSVAQGGDKKKCIPGPYGASESINYIFLNNGYTRV